MWSKGTFIIAIFSILSLQAGTLEVCPSCELNSIGEAIKLADPYDTLLIKSGRYLESNLVIDKPLTLIGYNYPLIDGQERGEIFTITSDHVTLSGLKIINVGSSYTTDYAAVRVVESSDFVISDLILEKLFFGIYLQKSSNGLVKGNTIKGDAKEEFNSGNGIQLWHCNGVRVEDNDIRQVRDGIYLEFSDNISIKNNTSKGNIRYGLHFMFSNNDTYEDNIFENNGAGVAVMFSKDIRMTGNTFRKNWGTAAFGLLLKEINDSEISGNVFEENTTSYSNNNFIRNGWALKVRGACYANRFTGNNFLYNSFDLSYNSNLNDNLFEQNFWSGYTGYDLDKNGIGDVPYRPVKLFSYIVNRTPETIVLLRSLFMDIIDFSERVSPVFTPDKLYDASPLMKKVP